VAAVLAILCFVTCATSQAFAAAKIKISLFGPGERIQTLGDLQLTRPDGTKLLLGHKWTNYFFVLSFGMSDDGYVLVRSDDRRQYIPLSGITIYELQKAKQLPDPLPTYAFTAFDYAYGYSGWIALVLPVAGLPLAWSRRRRLSRCSPFVENGLAYMQNGEPLRAIPEFDEALRIEPKLSQARLLRGRAYGQIGQVDKAIGDFSSVVARDRKNAEALLLRGMAFEHVGAVDKAIQDYTRVLKLEKHPHTYVRRGDASFTTGDVDGAVRDYTAAIRKKFVEAYPRRAAAYERKGRPDLAAKDREAYARASVRRA
jgi:tetratricopeptide (TPR) repeat protein